MIADHMLWVSLGILVIAFLYSSVGHAGASGEIPPDSSRAAGRPRPATVPGTVTDPSKKRFGGLAFPFGLEETISHGQRLPPPPNEGTET